MFSKWFKKREIDDKYYGTVSEIAKQFKITANQMNQIFLSLKWAKKEDKWWISTELGLENGAKQKYNTKNKQKYIIWNSKIKNDIKIICAIKDIKQKEIKKSEFEKSAYDLYKDKKTTEIKKMSNKEKKEKGDLYEIFVNNYYKNKGYKTAQHGKDNGKKDYGIDVIAKKDKEIIFIQCKNWSSNKVQAKDLKITRQDVNDYLEKFPMYKNLDYNIKIIYAISENNIHGSSHHYLKENNDKIELKIIPM